MSNFIAYPHIEKLGHLEVAELPLGLVHIFPKIDGTNACVWADRDGQIHTASRRKVLTPEADNAGFDAYIRAAHVADETSRYSGIVGAAYAEPGLRFFGEWLVPHTFKGYRDEAWRKFYVFDIMRPDGTFLNWPKQKELADAFGFEVIPPLALINHPTEEQLLKLLDVNTYLCQDGAGPGEGIVLKRYDFVGPFGRTTWAKMVRAEFKDRHKLVMGVKPSEGAMTAERDAAERFVTEAFVAKERAKAGYACWNASEHVGQPRDGKMGLDEYVASREGRKALIPRLLQTVFYELVREHAWDFGGKPGATIDFRQLKRLCDQRIKAFAKDLF